MRLGAEFLQSRFARRLLAAFVVSAVLPVVTLGALTFTSVTEQLLRQNRVQQEQEAKTFGLAVYEQLLLAEAELQLLAAQQPASLEHDLSKANTGSHQRLRERFDAIWRIDNAGQQQLLFGTGTQFPLSPQALLDNPRESTITTIQSSAGAARIFLSSVADESGQDKRALVVEINSEFLWNEESIESGKTFCMLGHEGELLFCSGTAPVSIGLEYLVKQASEQSFSGRAEWRAGDGEIWLASFWSVFLESQFGVPDWVSVVSTPRSEVLSPVSAFQNSFILVFIITLLLVLLLSGAHIRRILTPLRKLTSGIQAFGNTDFESEVVLESDDEFSKLADSFNAMGRKLSVQFKNLETMAEIDRLILTSSDADDVIRMVLSRITKNIGCDAIGLVSEDSEGQFSKLFYRSSLLPADDMEREVDIELRQADRALLEDNPSGTAVHPFDPAYSWLAPIWELQVRTCLVLPLFIEGKLSAVIALGYSVPPADADVLMQATKGWADRVAVALSNAKWQEKLFRQANFDALCEIPNRPAFRNFLKQSLTRAERNGEYVGLLLFDLDRFKLVNDTLGHAAGDKYLRKIATRISECVRSTDLLARLGGDEFTIVVSESADPWQVRNSVTAIAEKLLDVIPQPITVKGHELRTNASIGIAIYPSDANCLDDLVRNADSAMYHAKTGGGGTYHFYSEELNRLAGEQLRIESELRLAIKHDQFELYYQPQVHAISGEVLGAEALLRWNHPSREFMSPGVFIPMAEQSQLIVEIDCWVLNAVCKQIRLWQDEGRPNIRIAVNLSARFFRQDNVVELLEALVEHHGIKHRYLELEITEGTLIEDIESAIQVLETLTSLGFQLTIDDFGTGYSSLTYLKKLPIHKLKIDKSFVDHCNAENIDGALVKTIINMAATLGLDCIAEGVEELAQLEFLRLNGCTEIQGYYFSKPKPATEFAGEYLTRLSHKQKEEGAKEEGTLIT